MKTYKATVKLVFDNFGIEAKNKKQFIAKLKESFYSEYGLDLKDNEIQDIEEVK